MQSDEELLGDDAFICVGDYSGSSCKPSADGSSETMSSSKYSSSSELSSSDESSEISPPPPKKMSPPKKPSTRMSRSRKWVDGRAYRKGSLRGTWIRDKRFDDTEFDDSDTDCEDCCCDACCGCYDDDDDCTII